MSELGRVRVGLVDDHALVRDGIRALLALTRWIEVVGEAASGQEALALAEQARPDLLLVDIGLKDMNGLELTRRLGERHPQIRILILSMYENQEYVSTSVKVGARGYVLKDAPSREIVAAIKAVAEGGTFYTGGLAGKLDAGEAEDGGLTPRERQVLVLLARGLNNKQMARELAISVRTVETHRLSIRRKLDIDKPADLVTHAIKYGWQPD
ncbi:response regulator [Stutzerimonas azotifigens]|uniref:response regulator n=1 Tax=Stutzerimonas azotifigens TaxID=291995 RepID=UPI000419B694|nr:response regulator transcription factor [Stutzerimonas azotifigens]